MSFDVKYDDRLQKIRDAGAAAIKAIRQIAFYRADDASDVRC